ncbi:MAG: hypothetical protein K9J16_15305 [Melioribacteraceae bacterium]|nr:hypothetical protein [Melioribacteraceae bacterium]MCF8355063.1 hypothetical protein [Melioribacteraceae bacterium]MCF8395640.1 hypothetical protein [Melioribacteraceae bacterium]MCF8420281.1 hypothetical protein [Melioribacteraceae bacterium]
MKKFLLLFIILQSINIAQSYQIEIELEKDKFLVYENIPLIIKQKNAGDETIYVYGIHPTGFSGPQFKPDNVKIHFFDLTRNKELAFSGDYSISTWGGKKAIIKFEPGDSIVTTFDLLSQFTNNNEMEYDRLFNTEGMYYKRYIFPGRYEFQIEYEIQNPYSSIKKIITDKLEFEVIDPKSDVDIEAWDELQEIINTDPYDRKALYQFVLDNLDSDYSMRGLDILCIRYVNYDDDIKRNSILTLFDLVGQNYKSSSILAYDFYRLYHHANAEKTETLKNINQLLFKKYQDLISARTFFQENRINPRGFKWEK